MIEAAVVLSAIAQHGPDFVIILILLLANAVVGFCWRRHLACLATRSRNDETS
jgi:H+-transporting ATPase